MPAHTAGTGKSFAVGTLARGWSDPPPVGDDPPAGGRVFGLATSQVATDVLLGEGLTARNVTRWLDTQDRLAAAVSEHQTVNGDEGWRLRAGDLVVVDESAMTDTVALSAIHGHVDAAGAKLLLVGDHKQLAAVGAGGGMDMLAAAGSRYELADARRFGADWERAASLRLRAGDESVLRTYHQQGRLRDGGTRDQAETSAATAWLADTVAGRRSLLLVDSNEQAGRLSASLRAELVRLGRVDEHGVPLGIQGTFAGVGDLVQARRNGWDLAGVEGNRRGPINRETYRVTAVRDDGALEVTTDTTGAGEGEEIVLPAGYVAEHLVLGYASTVHAAQGSTVDTAHSVITNRTGPAALHVAMSRGREANTAHVATHTGPDDPADGTATDHSVYRDPVATLAGILDTSDQATRRSALTIASESAAEAGSARIAAELFADAAQLAATERTADSLDQLVDAGALTEDQRARIAAEDGTGALTRILRRAELAGHDPRAVLTEAVERGPLTGARNVSNVVYSRVRDAGRFDPVGDTWADWIPRTDDAEWTTYLSTLADAADARARELGVELADEPQRWTTEAFGAVPAVGPERDAWIAAAGRIAAYRGPAATTTRPTHSARHRSPGRSNSSPPIAPRGGTSDARRSTASTLSCPTASSGCACEVLLVPGSACTDRPRRTRLPSMTWQSRT